MKSGEGVPEGGWTALVLAGSRPQGDPLALACGVRHKALVEVAGVAMGLRVLRTLTASRSVGPIVVCGLDPASMASLPEIGSMVERGAVRLAAAAATPSQSVAGVLRRRETALPLLVTTADHPLLTPAIVDAFCREAEASQAAVVIGLVPADLVRQAFPTGRRTHLRFREGAYCTCNLFAFLDPASEQAAAAWASIERERKRPWRMVRMLGAGAVVRYLLGRLGLDDVFRLASARLGLEVRPVLLSQPEAGFDVDKPSDLEIADAFLRAREGP
jgi:GTP:adenosylcobinamide-phosphate guanylyltransferase